MAIGRRHITVALLIAVLFARAGAAQSVALVADSLLIRIPPRDLTVTGAPILRESRTVVVPTMMLYLSVAGTTRASSHAIRGSVSVTLDYDVAGLEKPAVEELAFATRIDVADRLRARGFSVLAADDPQVNRWIARTDRHSIDSTYTVPVIRDEPTKTTFAVLAPSDSQGVNTRTDASLAALRGLAKELNAVVVIPELWFSAPQVGSRRNFVPGALSSAVDVTQGMDLHAASLMLIGPSGAIGSITLRAPVRELSDNVGRIVDARDSTRFGALTARDARVLTSGGWIGMANRLRNLDTRQGVVFFVTTGAYDRAVQRGAASFVEAALAAFAKP